MFKGCILDIDNTIFSYDHANNLALELLFLHMESKYFIQKETLNVTYKKIQSEFKKSCNNALRHNKFLYIKKLLEIHNLPLVDTSSMVKFYNQAFTENMQMYDNFENFINLLIKNGTKICALSNNICSDQLDRLQKLNILDKFNFVITSDEIGEEKPNLCSILYCLHKLQLDASSVCLIGDNIQTDILPSIELKLFPFHFNENSYKHIHKNTHIEFSSYAELIKIFESFAATIDEFEYLSHLFGQSSNFVQGGGGNISIKMNNNKILLIKSSGNLLANVTKYSGYCILDNCSVVTNLANLTNSNNSTDIDILKLAHIWGKGIGSIESFFHASLKKYTVHLHTNLVNIFLTAKNFSLYENLGLNYYICDYFTPGSILSNHLGEKLKQLKYSVDVIFLLNHGIIITADNLNKILEIFETLHQYFKEKCSLTMKTIFDADMCAYNVTKLIKKISGKNCVVYNSKIVFNKQYFFPIKYCFPDLAVFASSEPLDTSVLTFEADIEKYIIANKSEPFLIFLDGLVFIVGDALQKCYILEQIIDAYNMYASINKTNLTEINDCMFLQNWDSEKYRKEN